MERFRSVRGPGVKILDSGGAGLSARAPHPCSDSAQLCWTDTTFLDSHYILTIASAIPDQETTVKNQQIWAYSLTSDVPQVRPAPNPLSSASWPGLSRPSAI